MEARALSPNIHVTLVAPGGVMYAPPSNTLPILSILTY